MMGHGYMEDFREGVWKHLNTFKTPYMYVFFNQMFGVWLSMSLGDTYFPLVEHLTASSINFDQESVRSWVQMLPSQRVQSVMF